MRTNLSIRYHDYITENDVVLVRELQEYCAGVAERGEEFTPTLINGDEGTAIWSDWDVMEIARIFNRSSDPVGLFRFVDEKTGSSSVGYKTRDGREWFYVLRQIRNASGIFFDILRNFDILRESL